MLNVRLAGKQLFTWLSLVVSLIASFCAVLFPLDEIWDLIESVSEGFLTYSSTSKHTYTTLTTSYKIRGLHVLF